jgi:hypothetical protein
MINTSVWSRPEAVAANPSSISTTTLERLTTALNQTAQLRTVIATPARPRHQQLAHHRSRTQ